MLEGQKGATQIVCATDSPEPGVEPWACIPACSSGSLQAAREGQEQLSGKGSSDWPTVPENHAPWETRDHNLTPCLSAMRL